MHFHHKTQLDLGIVICSLHGELIDKNQATDFIADIEKHLTAGNLKVVLDLTDLKYINSSGLNVLINILTKARKNGGEAVVASVSPKVKELFVITKLNTVFTVTDSVEKALSKLK